MDRAGPALSRAGGGARWVTAAALAAPAAFGAVFFAYPTCVLISTGLRRSVGTGESTGGIDLAAVIDVVTSSSTRSVVWFTLWQAVVSTALTVVAALPAAWVLARVRFRGRGLFAAGLVVPFVLPTVVVGSAFLVALGPDGPVAALARPFGIEVDLRHRPAAVIAAHVFFNYAVVARTVGAAWSGLDPSLEQAARTLGATAFDAWRRVVLPALRPAIAGATAIVFLFTFTSFGVIRILGGPRLATIEVEIHRSTTELLDLRTASVLSLIQMAAVAALLVVHRRMRPGLALGGTGASSPRSGSLGRVHGRARLGAHLVIGAVVVLLATPVLTLVWRSFDTASGPGLAYYRALGESRRGTTAYVSPWEAVANSTRFAVAAACIALVVGGLTAVALHRSRGRARGLLDLLVMLPMGTSAVTVGLGFLLALDEPPLDLRTSVVIIPAAQALLAIPFVVRTVLPALDAVPARRREAAAVLGASPWRVWWSIDAPALRRPAAVAFGFAAAMSLGEFGATVFIARADAPTVPVAIFRALSQPGALNVGQAMASSTILLVMTTAVMLVVDRAGDGRLGGF